MSVNYPTFQSDPTLNSITASAGISSSGNAYISGNVGVGTANPLFKLDVTGDGRFTSNLVVSGTIITSNDIMAPSLILNKSSDYAAIELGAPSGAYVDLKKPYSDDFDIRLASDNNIEGGGYLYNHGGAILSLSGSNVGIGTYGPDARLHVKGGSSNDAIPEIKIEGTTGGGWTAFYNNLDQGQMNGLVQAGDKGILFSDGTTNTGELVIGPYSTGANYAGLRITSAGNIGIGTPNPFTRLDVQDNQALGWNARLTNTNSGANTTKAIGIEFRGVDTVGTNKETAVLQVIPADNDYIGSSVVISTRASDSVTEKVRISSAGNVGIGTTSPSDKLQVSGPNDRIGLNVAGVASTLNFGSTVSGEGTRAINFDRSTGLLKIQGGNVGSLADYVTITTAGNVGIGTTNPNYKLEVNGTISGSAVYGLSGSSAQFPNFTTDVRNQFSAGTNITINNGVISASGGGGGSGTVNAGSAGYIAYYPSAGTTVDDAFGSTGGLYWDNTNGKIGVGLTNPARQLSLVGQISVVSGGVGEDVSYNGSFISTRPTTTSQHINLIKSSTRVWSIGFKPGGAEFLIANGESTDSDFGNNQPFCINSAGNVGIGTTNPGATKKLEVNGNIGFTSNGQGIDFGNSAGGGSTSNLLNDYEEGTWTPAFSASINSNFSYTIQAGSYTKIGNSVSCFGRIYLSATGSSNGSVYLNNLPFPVINFNSGFTVSLFSNFNNLTNIYGSPPTTNSSVIQLSTTSGATAGSTTNVTVASHLKTNSILFFGIFYTTTS